MSGFSEASEAASQGEFVAAFITLQRESEVSPRRQPVSKLLIRSVGILAVLLGMRAAMAAQPVRIDWSRYDSVQGQPVSVDGKKWTIVCFLGAECPLARLYGPRLQRMAEEFEDPELAWIGVNSNPQDTPADVREFVKTHGISFPVIKDGSQQLARRLGATRTPEVLVLSADGQIGYRGRIDDQYQPGISRAAPTRHDLQDAIEALRMGRPLENASTTPVGCLITFTRTPRPPPDPSRRVTFARDVAPILNAHCVECHRRGEIGPFKLTEYNEVVGWAEMILEVIEENRMPPWHADPRYGKFAGARHLPAEARAVLVEWVAQGMPPGDVGVLTAPPAPSSGWHLDSKPELVLEMREQPFDVPAEGTVEYQYFVVDPEWGEDRWVRAAQVIPGNASVVHHAIVFVRPPDGSDSRGIGWMGGYVPGQRTVGLPLGHARRIPAGSKLVFQMHYTPNGQVTRDITKVGVWFSDASEVTHEVTTRVALNHHFEIPPRAKDHMVEVKLDGFPRDATLLGMMPHMHLRGKSFRCDVVGKAQTTTLLSVPRYDFNWQHWYQLQTPLALRGVEAFDMQVRFDNSAANPTNPDPEQFVTWGDQTWQEMAVAFLDIAHPRDTPRKMQNAAEITEENAVERQRRIAVETDRFLSQLDRNGDGIVVSDETPDAFRKFGFQRIDANGDGKLERSEIEAEAARRL